MNYKILERKREDEPTEAQREMAELFIDSLLSLKENYSHVDMELVYDIENIISELEEYC